MSRKMIAALQSSLDGFAQGEDLGEEEWVESWADGLALVPDVDAFVQGARMYPGYADFWSAIERDPTKDAPFHTRKPFDREVAYAQRAAKTPHYVLSTTLESVSWPPTAKIVRSLDELHALKGAPGKNIYVVGGPTLVGSLLDAGLLDELRLIVNPLLLGKGAPLFQHLAKRRRLRFVSAEPTSHGRVVLSYSFDH